MISLDMLKRCQNELKQAFCALPDDVQSLMREYGEYIQALRGHIGGVWWGKFNGELAINPEKVFRLSPDTPTEPEWVELDVNQIQGFYQVDLGDARRTDNRAITWAMCRVGFLGIIHQKDGIETLRTSIDAAFGTPVRVRFSKT